MAELTKAQREAHDKAYDEWIRAREDHAMGFSEYMLLAGCAYATARDAAICRALGEKFHASGNDHKVYASSACDECADMIDEPHRLATDWQITIIETADKEPT